MVNVFERKILHLIENIMAKIFRITSSRYGCHITGLHTKNNASIAIATRIIPRCTI